MKYCRNHILRSVDFTTISKALKLLSWSALFALKVLQQTISDVEDWCICQKWPNLFSVWSYEKIDACKHFNFIIYTFFFTFRTLRCRKWALLTDILQISHEREETKPKRRMKWNVLSRYDVNSNWNNSHELKFLKWHLCDSQKC